MASALLNPDVLRELLKLSEQKASLEKQLTALDARVEALLGGKAPAPAAKVEKAPAAPGKRRGRPPGAPKAEKAPKAAKSGGKRGALKGQLLQLLAEAGPEGASVKDLAAKLGVKNQNVHVWFSTTGKKLPEITKVGEARYAFISQPSASPAPEVSPVLEASPQPVA